MTWWRFEDFNEAMLCLCDRDAIADGDADEDDDTYSPPVLWHFYQDVFKFFFFHSNENKEK